VSLYPPTWQQDKLDNTISCCFLGGQIWFWMYRPVLLTKQNDDDHHLHSKKIDQINTDKLNINTIFMIQTSGFIKWNSCGSMGEHATIKVKTEFLFSHNQSQPISCQNLFKFSSINQAGVSHQKLGSMPV